MSPPPPLETMDSNTSTETSEQSKPPLSESHLGGPPLVEQQILSFREHKQVQQDILLQEGGGGGGGGGQVEGDSSEFIACQNDQKPSEFQYPGFAEKAFFYLDQKSRPRCWCLKAITWPYPF